jgi:hypothetical protein
MEILRLGFWFNHELNNNFPAGQTFRSLDAVWADILQIAGRSGFCVRNGPPHCLRKCESARNGALTQFWWRSSARRDDARLEQIETASTIHLAFDHLQLVDLAFGLRVRPRR